MDREGHMVQVQRRRKCEVKSLGIPRGNTGPVPFFSCYFFVFSGVVGVVVADVGGRSGSEGMGCYARTRTSSEDADTRSAEIAYYEFIVFKREPALSSVRCYPVEYR
jgi:hypothetical protein